jgi:hypothetical protein
LTRETLRESVRWHREYRPQWDDEPGKYVEHGIVRWARSRRLGLFTLGHIKAYLGVQHVDPSRAGWAIVGEPEARFFLSLFVSGRVITLRTFPTMDAALNALSAFLSSNP